MAEFSPAEKGDLFLITYKHSYTSLHGPGGSSLSYSFRRVTNVTRDGKVTGYASLSGNGENEFFTKPRAGITHPGLVVSHKRIDADAAYKALGPHEYESIEKARDAIRPFLIHKNPERGKTIHFPDVKKALAIGKIVAVEYESIRDGKIYRHGFTKSRPQLAVSIDGKQLLILGGGYRVTERGIEDA